MNIFNRSQWGMQHDLGSCAVHGEVPELVDGPDLGSGAAMRRGSSPRFPTTEVPLTNILAPPVLKHQPRHAQALEHCSSPPPITTVLYRCDYDRAHNTGGEEVMV